MIVIGVDVHKQSVTAVAVDDAGRMLDERTVVVGSDELIGWAEALGTERLWAIEDCRLLTPWLERQLLDLGEGLVRVSPKLTVPERRAGRTRGKSDPIDALAVARRRAARRELRKKPAAPTRPRRQPATQRRALTLRQRTAQPRDAITVWGNACGSGRETPIGMPIYLAPSAVQVAATVFAPRPPGPPYRLLGRMRCTNTFHAWGDGGFWNATLRFRVPQVQPGRYQLVIYCQVCHHGTGANLVANNWYFDGKRRTTLSAFSITRCR
jgi:hypothetical protein